MRAIRRVRLFGVFVLVTLAAGLATWYLTFTAQRERDLTRTNLRILNRVADQLDRTIDGQELAFWRLPPLAKASRMPSDKDSWLDAARGQIPSLRFVRNDDIKEITTKPPASPRRLPRRHQITVDGRDARLVFTLVSETGPVFQRTISMELGSLITPILTPLLRDGSFVAVAVVTEDGRVLHAVGDRSAELMLTRLDKLAVVKPKPFLRASAPSVAIPNTFATGTSTTPSATDVVLLGAEHKLFTHPCCPVTAVVSQGGTTGVTRPATPTRLVLVGIADASEFRSKVHEISPTLVFSGVAGILLVLAAWPFLKLRLIGDRQRVRRRDVAAVVACGTFGLALLTTIFLDVFAYTWLQHVRDQQLKAFAAMLSTRAKAELGQAYGQLSCLTKAALATSSKNEAPRSKLFESSVGHAVRDCHQYPLFETFALIDNSGAQAVKWSAQRWVPVRVNVSRRAYVTEVVENRLWQQPECPMHGCVVESIWSATTMKPEAVVSMPAMTGDRKDFPVAALSIPMHALVDSVIPAGFEFAVLRSDGLVLFHSDSQRNTFENMFRETSHDRRLRAAVSGGSDETFRLQYAGRSYRAYVTRLGVGDWSVLTMSPNERVWAMHTEWLVIWLAAMSMHMLLFALLFGTALWRRESTWLWWDPRQTQRYRMLAGVMLGFLIAGFTTLYVADDGWLIVLTSALPLTAWLVALLVLRRQPPATEERSKGLAAYTVAALLLLLLTSVIPASGFFVAAYEVQLRSHVKHALVELVRELRDTTAVRERHYRSNDWPGVDDDDLIAHRDGGIPKTKEFGFQFATRELEVPTTPPQPSQKLCPPSNGGSPFTWFLEDVLPYYSEYSVHSRQYLHDQAGDDSWRWTRQGSTLSLCLKAEGYQASIASTMPALRDAVWRRSGTSSAPDSAGPVESAGVWLLRASLSLTALTGLVLLTWLFFRFIKTHICLTDVDQPLRSGSRLRASGENLFVVSDGIDHTHLVQGTHPVSLHAIASAPNPDRAWARTLSQLDIQPPGRPVRVSDFVDHLEDPALAHRKLGWVEALADRNRSLIIVSSVGPRMIEHTLGMPLADGSAAAPQLLERWRLLSSSFVVVDRRTEDKRSGETQAIEQVVRQTDCPRSQSTDEVTGPGLDALRAEAAADAFVRAICASIESSVNRRKPPDRRASGGSCDDRPGPGRRRSQRRQEHLFRLMPPQVFDEVSERTSAWYGAIWSACSQDEKLTLADIADDGFVNYKKRRTVRRLLARGLVMKDPGFRLMNETFRRFVLSSECRAEVRDIEGAVEPSPWDALRLPFFVVLFGAGLFFVSTQRELFNATVAALTALMGAVPVLFRAIGMMGGKGDVAVKPNT